MPIGRVRAEGGPGNAVYDFEGQEATELSVKQGEVLVAKGPPADDWLLVSLQRDPTRSGYVPVGYVERMEAARVAPVARRSPGEGPRLGSSGSEFRCSGPCHSLGGYGCQWRSPPTPDAALSPGGPQGPARGPRGGARLAGRGAVRLPRRPRRPGGVPCPCSCRRL